MYISYVYIGTSLQCEPGPCTSYPCPGDRGICTPCPCISYTYIYIYILCVHMYISAVSVDRPCPLAVAGPSPCICLPSHTLSACIAYTLNIYRIHAQHVSHTLSACIAYTLSIHRIHYQHACDAFPACIAYTLSIHCSQRTTHCVITGSTVSPRHSSQPDCRQRFQ
jgi:hypothetical protein